MTYRVLAFDPGGTTGYKLWDAETQTFSGRQLTTGHHLQIYKLMDMLNPDVVIYESFEYRNKSRPGLVLDSREYIGIIKLWAYQNTLYDLVVQTPAQAKGFVSDATLKKGNMWMPGNPHENDACRHLVYYIINSGNDHLVDLRKQLLELMYK